MGVYIYNFFYLDKFQTNLLDPLVCLEKSDGVSK